MAKTYKVWEDRFRLNFAKDDLESRVAVKYMEGRRWHQDLRWWSVPGSWRCAKQLREFGFEPVGLETAAYLQDLENLVEGNLSVRLAGQPTKVGHYELYQYQREGLAFLGDRGLLYDAPGVGKTLQAIAWAEHDPRVLVVAPRAVLHQWGDYVSDIGRRAEIQPEGELLPEGWYITNYERLDRISVPPPYTLIVDEAHYVKNTKSQRSKAVLSLGSGASRVLALTGSPVVNRPIELWPLYLLLGQRNKSEFFGFAKRYCGAEQNGFGWDFGGATHLDELKEDMAHFALRRELSIGKDKRYTTLHVSAGDARSKLDEDGTRVLDKMLKGASMFHEDVLADMQRLRISLALSKVEDAYEWAKEYINSSGKGLVVFCAFKEPLKQFAKKCGGTATLYTGDETEQQRLRAVSDFIRGDKKVICLTYGAGGTGLDGLQYASEVAILLDLPWTPAELEQAEGRVYRSGQSNTVQIVKVLSDTLIDQALMGAIDSKQDIIDFLNGVGGGAVPDIMSMLTRL